MKLKNYAIVIVFTFLSLGIAYAQGEAPKAPHYFWANPAIFTHRVASIQSFDTHIDSLEYDTEGYLIARSTHPIRLTYNPENGKIVDRKVEDKISWVKYLYDANHYVAEIQECRAGQTSADIVEVISSKHNFIRDENGFIQSTEHWVKDSEDADSEELTPFQRFDYTYDAKGRLIACDNKAFDQNAQTWNTLKTCTLTYNEQGQISRIAWVADTDPVLSEDFSYDEKGKLTEILFINDKADELRYEYLYDEKGNIINLGRDGFHYKVEYNTELMRSKTYIPRQEFGTATGVKYLDAATEFYHIPWMMTSNVPSTIMSSFDKEGESPYNTITYEVVPGSTGTQLLASENSKALTYQVNEQSILVNTKHFKGEELRIYTLSGASIKTMSISEDSTIIDRARLPKELLILSVGESIAKVQNY